MINRLLTIVILILITLASFSRDAYKAIGRYDYYTTETSAEIVIWIPDAKSNLNVTVDIVFEFDHVFKGEVVKSGQLNFFEIPIERFHRGDNEVTVSYNENGKWVASDKVNILVLEDQYNAVKIDRVSCGLVVEGLPFFPFGFYAYSPVQPTLPEEEVVKGFNMMSPYQVVEGKTLKDRKAYMDRCATLGMKVNYNLLSIAGGGGVGHKDHKRLSHKKRIKLLQKEVETFKDHPALLSWYISDEPVGQGVPADSLVEAYTLIKQLDPYHPISVVFMTPSMAKEYSHVMDIVMADPYPIPHGKVDEVAGTAAMLNAEFFMEKPVWIVPQAFGGNEWWEREPTPQELRAMTYLGIVNDAMGIQYFIRHGLNSFPKSTIAWNECASMALEIAELTPYLFTSEPEPEINSPEIDIQLKGFHLNGTLIVIAVNTANQPMNFSFSVEDLQYSGTGTLIFEDRKFTVRGGKVEDIIDAYGTRVYKIRYKMTTNKGFRLHAKNILKDPSFENIAGTGVPASCYAKGQGDKGATYFIDSRVSALGEHSLRLTTPTADEGMKLSFMRLNVNPNQSYTMSVVARSIPMKYRDNGKKSFWKKICGCGPDKEDYPVFRMSFMGSEELFIPDNEWNEYSFTYFPSYHPHPLGEVHSLSPELMLLGKGTAWFDMVQVYPDMGLKSSISKDHNDITIGLSTIHQDAEIYYTLSRDYGYSQSDPPTLFKRPFTISETSTVTATAYKDGQKVGYIQQYFVQSYATGRYVEYKHKYSPKYHAGHKDGLVDGITGSKDFKDGNWQGFEGEDLDVLINLKEVRDINFISIDFLRNRASWIFLPVEVKILWSKDGNEFTEILYSENVRAPDYHDPYIKAYSFDDLGIEARYIRFVAKNIKTCPEGHPGEGGKAWLFTDEIIIQ